MQPYQGQPNFDGSKSFYSGAPSSQSAYAPQQTPTQQNMARFGGPMASNAYGKNEMGPPSAPGTVNAGDAEHHDIKPEQYPHGHVPTGSTEAEPEHQHENSYMGTNGSAYGSNRTQYAYNPPASVGTVQGDHAHLSPEMAGSPHQTGSGRATPRGTNGAHQWQQGYSTPPRATQSSNLYNVMSDSRGANGTPTGDHYASSYTSASLNGTSTSNKRGREDDSDSNRPESRGMESGFDLKRRKTIRQDAMGVPMGQMSSLQGIKTGGGMPRQR
jgi:enhanced filamentous growth protein 1